MKADMLIRFGLRSLVAAYFLVAASVAWFYPRSNWDMVPYVALTIEKEGEKADELHRKAWEIVRSGVSDGEFLQLTADRPYRVVQYADPAAFDSILSFYRIKLLYIEISRFLGSYIGAIEALRLINVLSLISIGFCVICWTGNLESWRLLVLVFCLVGFADLGYIAQHVTPDLFAGALLIGGVLAWRLGKSTLGGILLFLSMLARPDHIVFIGVLAILDGVIRRRLSVTAIVGMLFVPVYFAISASASHPGWWVHFWFSHVEFVPNINGFNPPLSIVVYLQSLIAGLVRILSGETWWVLFVLEVLAIIEYKDRIAKWSKEYLILLATILSMPLKFAIAPMFESRFYVIYMLVAGLILIPTMRPLNAETLEPR